MWSKERKIKGRKKEDNRSKRKIVVCRKGKREKMKGSTARNVEKRKKDKLCEREVCKWGKRKIGVWRKSKIDVYRKKKRDKGKKQRQWKNGGKWSKRKLDVWSIRKRDNAGRKYMYIMQ
jgi:hypothetical protein